MPSIRKRVYGLIRTFSSPNQSADEAEGSPLPSPLEEHPELIPGSSLPPSPQEHSFIYLYLSGRLKKPAHPEIYYGKTGVDLPILHIEKPTDRVCASYTGPNGGLTQVPSVKKQSIVNIANLDDELSISFDTESLSDGLRADSPNNSRQGQLDNHSSLPPSLANSLHERYDSKFDWEKGTDRAYGLSTSLYECHPITKIHAGSPVADVFGILARKNNCVLALADGVNWGDRARLAARCAVRGAIDHLNENLFNEATPARSTLGIFHVLLGAFHAAHQLIIQESGLLTTLCVTVVCKLKNSSEWVVCSCNVGDSLCFVYSQKYGVREVTLGSHDIKQMRDMRDAGGALGPVDGVNPELQNLTCAMTVVEDGDLVFITSDGVSDNFDPVVGKFCVIKQEEKENLVSPTAERKRSAPPMLAVSGLGQAQPYPVRQKQQVEDGRKVSNIEDRPTSPRAESKLPMVEAHQRHELMLLRMEDLLRNGVTVGDAATQSAKDLCENMVNFANQLTMAKRRILEDPDLYGGDSRLNRIDQRQRRRMVREKIAEMPGKLDHATVVAYKVGEWPEEEEMKEDELFSETTVLEDGEPKHEDPESTPRATRKKLPSQNESESCPPTPEPDIILPEESVPPDPPSAKELDAGVVTENAEEVKEGSNGGKVWTDLLTNSCEERVRMIDDSSQSSSVSSGLQDSCHLDSVAESFQEDGTRTEISGECTLMEREASEEQKVPNMDNDQQQCASGEVFAATTVVEEMEKLDNGTGFPEEVVEMDMNIRDERGESVEGVLYLSNLESTVCCGEIMENSEEEEVEMTLNDAPTFVSCEVDPSANISSDTGLDKTSNWECQEDGQVPVFSHLDAPPPPSDVQLEDDIGELCKPGGELQTPETPKEEAEPLEIPAPEVNLKDRNSEDTCSPEEIEKVSPNCGSSGNSVTLILDKDLVPPVREMAGEEYSSLMNTSYYIATGECSIFADEKVFYDNHQFDAFDPPGNLTPTSAKNISKTFEKVENSLKRKKKHKRGSPTRHTLGVDAGWLRKLAAGRMGSRKSRSSVSTESSRDSKEEKLNSPRKGFPFLPLASATGRALKDRLKILGSPLRAASSEQKSARPISVSAVPKTEAILTGRSLNPVLEARETSSSADSMIKNVPVESRESRKETTCCSSGVDMVGKVGGNLVSKRSSSESPVRLKKNVGGGLVHYASDTEVTRQKPIGSRSFQKPTLSPSRMRTRVSSTSKVQSIV